MLSVQNQHLVKPEDNNEESVIVHATRSGGRRPSARSGGLSNAKRWALGAGAATAGIAIMSRTKTGRKLVKRVAKTRLGKSTVKLARKYGKKVGKTRVGQFAAARVAGARRIGTSARNAVGRVRDRVVGSRVGTYVSKAAGKARGTATNAYRRAARTTRAATSRTARRVYRARRR